MHAHLIEAFRHSAWATKTLITICRERSREELDRPARGFGSMLKTLNHIVQSDAIYAGILTGNRPAWATDGADTDDLDQLDGLIDETLREWERLLARPVDPDRTLLLDRGTYECHASIVVVQAIVHAAGHREQIRLALAAMGATPPDLQPWAYAMEAGRAVVRA